MDVLYAKGWSFNLMRSTPSPGGEGARAGHDSYAGRQPSSPHTRCPHPLRDNSTHGISSFFRTSDSSQDSHLELLPRSNQGATSMQIAND